MELHDGSIAVTSEGEGLGCTFTVDLPVYFDWTKETPRGCRISRRRSMSNLVPVSVHLDGLNDHLPFDERSPYVSSVNQSRSHSVLIGDRKSNLDCIDVEDMREAARLSHRGNAHPDIRPSLGHSALVTAFFSPAPSPTFTGCLSIQSGLHVLGAPVEENIGQNNAENDPLPPTVGESNLPFALIEVKHIHVLVVDDSCLNRKMMCRSMKGRCQCAGEACDGLEALKKVQTACDEGCPYHVVLMDYKMPNLDGPDTARRLRSHGFDGLIVGVTGMTETCDIDDFMSAGADFVLTKPVNEDELDRIFHGKC